MFLRSQISVTPRVEFGDPLYTIVLNGKIIFLDSRFDKEFFAFYSIYDWFRLLIAIRHGRGLTRRNEHVIHHGVPRVVDSDE